LTFCLYLELQNRTHAFGKVALTSPYTDNNPEYSFALMDGGGRPVPKTKDVILYDLAVWNGWLEVPPDAMTRISVAPGDYDATPPATILRVRLGCGQPWALALDPTQRYFLSGTFRPGAARKYAEKFGPPLPAGAGESWEGTLELPGVSLPARKNKP
jgi:hypothetical protein